MKPATQDEFNQQVDKALTRLEANALACEIMAQHVAATMWPWQKRALRRALVTLSAPYTLQPHRYEVCKRAKQVLTAWIDND